MDPRSPNRHRCRPLGDLRPACVQARTLPDVSATETTSFWSTGTLVGYAATVLEPLCHFGYGFARWEGDGAKTNCAGGGDDGPKGGFEGGGRGGGGVPCRRNGRHGSGPAPRGYPARAKRPHRGGGGGRSRARRPSASRVRFACGRRRDLRLRR